MKRSNRVLLLAHCLLNQNTVVKPLARAKGPFGALVTMLSERGIGMETMCCPERDELGLGRRPMDKAEYDTPSFRARCTEEAVRIQACVEDFERAGIHVMGLVGIEESPTCSIRAPRGHLMDALSTQPCWTHLARIDVPCDYAQDGCDEASAAFECRFADWLDGLLGTT